MFENDVKKVSLAQKVAELIKTFKELKAQNETLRNDLVALKGQNEALGIQISKLENDANERVLNDDELFKEIDEVLQK
ncbi:MULTISPECIES: hypothetical protein [Campylobacter]|uniref:hypothetical protein n=1 Tax=Campylobacter TaxID=194 RepID=UPI0023F47DF3|nr:MULTISPECIES: hypothetical protein [Campylobacter]MCI6642487.1 hypothetical protein [Campylobacter sp.]MDD7422982.1 hypothetical protein [Campylobacter hominis]MDY3116845.1 hypothetical protein [Campylobacter hominis]